MSFLISNLLSKGKVEIILRDKDGGIKDYQLIHNTFTEVGDAHVADQLSGQLEGPMTHMADGTGTGGGSTSTTLVSELSRVALTSTAQGTGANDNDVTYSATWGVGVGTGAITEAGIFNDPTAGTMLVYSSFAVKNKGALDTLTINWTLTFGAS